LGVARKVQKGGGKGYMSCCEAKEVGAEKVWGVQKGGGKRDMA